MSDRKGSSAAEKFRLPLIDTRVRIRRRVAFRHRRCGSRVVAGLAGTRASSEAMPQRLRPLGNKGQSRINFPKSNFVIPAQVRHSRAGGNPEFLGQLVSRLRGNDEVGNRNPNLGRFYKDTLRVSCSEASVLSVAKHFVARDSARSRRARRSLFRSLRNGVLIREAVNGRDDLIFQSGLPL